MKVIARRTGGYAHDVEIEGGHVVRIDEPAAAGGTDTGPAPTRLLAASLAGCTAITIEMYAERRDWEVGQIEVDVDAEYRDGAPLSFAVTLRLPSELSDEQRKRLLVVAGKCPVHKLIAGETEVTITDKIETL
ncbi:MAG TPA: OsmC family protein [Solirubrobacterales bacterium]|nr:OsmC family protein [Solirubrobacterales bacterium]